MNTLLGGLMIVSDPDSPGEPGVTRDLGEAPVEGSMTRELRRGLHRQRVADRALENIISDILQIGRTMKAHADTLEEKLTILQEQLDQAQRDEEGAGDAR